MKKVLLLVPDNVLGTEMRESFLDRGSFAIRTAGNATEAVAMVSVWRPSLILFKSDLGDMSVTAFCKAVRAQCGQRDTKMLMLTDSVGGEGEDAEQEGYNGHLISPVDPRQLLHTIATLLDVRERRAPRAPLETLVRAEGFQELASKEENALANSINISENGMLLESNCPFMIGSRGLLHFFLPESTERVTVTSVVRTVMDEVRLYYALEFLELANYHREMIRQYVERHTKK